MTVKKHSVLIAEDHVEWCNLLKKEIEQSPSFRVVACLHDGKSALEFICRSKPDIVILDLVMPVFDGLYIVGKIREALPEYSPLIYILSIINTPHINDILLDLKIGYYSVKPIAAAAVAYNIQKLVDTNDYPFYEDTPDPTAAGLDIKIEDYLINMGAPMYLVSTKCTLAALHFVIASSAQVKNGCAIYEEVAAALSTTPGAVERNIRSTIKHIRRQETPTFLKFFPFSQKKLTNIEFLQTFKMYFLREVEAKK